MRRKQKSEKYVTKFYIQFNEKWFKRGDILILSDSPIKCRVIRAYRLTWWRILRMRLGLRIKLFDLERVKVKTTKTDNDGNRTN